MSPLPDGVWLEPLDCPPWVGPPAVDELLPLWPWLPGGLPGLLCGELLPELLDEDELLEELLEELLDEVRRIKSLQLHAGGKVAASG